MNEINQTPGSYDRLQSIYPIEPLRADRLDDNIRAQLNALYRIFPGQEDTKDGVKYLEAGENNRIPLVYVVKNGDRVIASLAATLMRKFGSAPADQNRSVIQLTHAVTDPDFRRQGIMNVLIDSVMADVQSDMVTQIQAASPDELIDPEDEQGLEKDEIESQVKNKPVVFMETTESTGVYPDTGSNLERVAGIRNSFLRSAIRHGWSPDAPASYAMTGSSSEAAMFVNGTNLELFTTTGIQIPAFPVDLDPNKQITVPVRSMSQAEKIYTTSNPEIAIDGIIQAAEDQGVVFNTRKGGEMLETIVYGQDVHPQVETVSRLFSNAFHGDSLRVVTEPTQIRTVVSK